MLQYFPVSLEQNTRDDRKHRSSELQILAWNIFSGIEDKWLNEGKAAPGS